MLKKLSFGQYIYKKSVVHSLDPRLKILYILALSILLFFINNTLKILFFSFFVLVILLLSKIGAKNLIKNLKSFLFIFIFLFIMYLIFSRDHLESGIIAIWRFLMLIILSLILTFTTTVSNLVAAIEKLIKPLKIFNVKLRNVAVMISITIRFVPVMFINLEKLKDAMIARLADFKKLRYIRLIVLALFERMLKSASNLSDAMQSRLYDEDMESSKILTLRKYDYISIIVVLAVILIIY